MGILLATLDEKFAESLKEHKEVVATIGTRSDLEREINNLITNVDILFMTEAFECEGVGIDDIMIKWKKTFPNLRVIFLKSEEYNNRTKVMLQRLTENGIYDIIIAEEVTLGDIIHLIDEPKSLSDVQKILDSPRYTGTYNRMFLFSSLKPGTGKTFLSTNVAVAIAKYGQKTRSRDGTMVEPRVLLVDGDLANLGVSTLLRAENFDRNMLHALKQVRNYIGENGELLVEEGEMAQVRSKIISFLTRYKLSPNLYIMGANNIPREELDKIAPEHFYFMLQQLVSSFHVIICDSNSAFDHPTTAGLYDMSGHIYLMLDNDYNNIQNTRRYYKQIKELGYGDKVKFIVNKNLSRDTELTCLEDLAYEVKEIDGLSIEDRIPLIEAGVMKTLDYSGDLVVLSDKAPEAKKQILDIADGIWKIDYSKVEEDENLLKDKGKKENKLVSMLNK